MKKISKLLLSILLIFTLTSCKQSLLGKEEFEKWLTELPELFLGNEDYELYAIFEDPTSAGIDVNVEGLTFLSKEEYEESIQLYKDLKKQLKQYDYKQLDEDLKITYDLIDDCLTSMLNQKDFYYLTTNYFDVNNGVQSSLAMNLYFMDIVSSDCLDAMINVVKSTSEIFPEYVDFEKERQKNGYGLSENYMEEVLSQLNSFNSQDQSYILRDITAKIRNVSFLNEEEKNNKIKQFSDAFNNHFIPAFKQLEKDLKEVEILTENKDASLYDYKHGKEYYESILYETTGFKNVDSFDVYLNKVEDKLINRFMDLMKQYPELANSVNNGNMNVTYTTLNNAKEVLSFLENKVNVSTDFPSLDSFSYKMDIVPKEMQDIIKASAAYFIGPIDNKEASEQMILNGSFDQSDYNTIAHEGFPGHMYQYRYFKSTKHNVLRDILTNTGYNEAWAVYASKEMNEYALDKALSEFMSINDDLTYLYLLRMDYMIHYDGESREEIYSYIKENFGIKEEEVLSEVYEQTLSDPGIFLPYYGYYYRLLDLKEEMKETLGNEYTEYDFHKKVLDAGSVPYHILEEYVLGK